MSMRIAEAVQRAERAELRGDFEKALDGFIEARRLMQNNPQNLESEVGLQPITERIEKISKQL